MKTWLRYLPLILISGSFLIRCATQTQPQGGPKDTIPPKFRSSIPEQNEKNFKGKLVTLEFDESIKLKDQKEIIITPSPGKNVTILAKNKSLTIEPKLPWKDSTTYSISFREGVQDITESNITRNLHLAFSTGPVIDSLSLSGFVHFALKETIPERTTVAIYQADTFNIQKHQPQYFTETNKDGSFQIQNLKPGRYKIYAFEDKNNNLKVDTQSELFGFQADSISVTKNTNKINLYIVRVDSRPLKLNNIRHNIKLTRLKLSKPITNYKIQYTGQKKFVSAFGDNTTEINIYHPETFTDSISTRLTATDSVEQRLDTTFYVKSTVTKAPKETFKIKIRSAEISTETGIVESTIEYNLPLKTIRPDTMLLRIDSSITIKLSPQDFIQDTARQTATFRCPIDLKILKTLTQSPQLFISKNVFITIENDSSKRMTAPVTFIKPGELATFSVTIKTAQPHYLIQLVTKDYQIIRSVKDQPNIVFKNLPATEYKLRAVIDTNNNGTWDPGSIIKRHDPERMIYYRSSDKKYDIPLRANWEVGPYTLSF